MPDRTAGSGFRAAAPARMTASSRLSLGLATAGSAASAYLTVEHYTANASLACPQARAIDCAKVTSSSWAMVGPMPVALLGLLYFAAMVVLCGPPLWREPRLDAARLALAVAGVASAIYFVWVELFRLDAICLWCTAVHLCAFGLLATALWRLSERPTGPLTVRSR